ncbi:MAG: DUF2855 family protein [Pseudomonadota bacterium]
MAEQQQLLVNKNDLSDVRWQASSTPDLNEGQILVKVTHFALTANNITYAVAGESMGYWQFFPTEEGWGRVPVWGFGDVIESRHPQVEVGQRLYGYYPAGSHLVIDAERVNAQGLVDAAPHRAALPKVYNQYSHAAAQDASHEAAEMLYRPLYMTSFVLDDFVSSEQFFGAEQVILTSASSKTSLGLAFLLHQRQQCRVIGLTSPKNTAFVESLGCYDEVVEYDQVTTLDPDKATVVVDMAGNGTALAAIHNHFADQLKYSCLVGATHWDARAGAREMAGPEPKLFFAPDHIVRRTEEWGGEGFQQRFQGAWDSFVSAAADWVQIEQVEGASAVGDFYLELLGDRVQPSRGYILSL